MLQIQSLSQFAVELGFLIEEYAGSKGKFPPTKRRMKNVLYVCTIEKANTLVTNSLKLVVKAASQINRYVRFHTNRIFVHRT